MSDEYAMMRMIVDRDHLRAAKIATKRQTALEDDASAHNMTVEAYLRYTNAWPMSEGDRPMSPSEIPKRAALDKLVDWDTTQAAQSATANQMRMQILAEAAGETVAEYMHSMDVWPMSRQSSLSIGD